MSRIIRYTILFLMSITLLNACLKEDFILPKPCFYISQDHILEIIGIEFDTVFNPETVRDEPNFKLCVYRYQTLVLDVVVELTVVDHEDYQAQNYADLFNLFGNSLSYEEISDLGQEAIWIPEKEQLLVQVGSLTLDIEGQDVDRESMIAIAEKVIEGF